jgi:hypothetical protein
MSGDREGQVGKMGTGFEIPASQSSENTKSLSRNFAACPLFSSEVRLLQVKCIKIQPVRGRHQQVAQGRSQRSAESKFR